MTRDDIIRMAREAGFNVEKGYLLRITGIDEDLERFANLVASAERKACVDVIKENWRYTANSEEMVYYILERVHE